MSKECLPRLETALSLAESISDFILHQRASRHSPRTIENHLSTLTPFAEWISRHDVTKLSEVTPQLVREYIVEFQNRLTQYGKLPSSNTVYTHFKNLKAFFRFHFEEENLSKNPMARLRPPRVDKTILPALEPHEIKLLLACTSGKDFISLRNRALICFLVDSGCRLNELVNLKVSDVNFQTGMVRISRGKGAKDRFTRVGARSLQALSKYLRRRSFEPNDALWTSYRGPMSRDGITTTLQRLGQACGVKANAHSFRRTTALTMLRAGCDIYSLQLLLGHSDLDVLRRYLSQTEVDVQTAHERYGPLDQIL